VEKVVILIKFFNLSSCSCYLGGYTIFSTRRILSRKSRYFDKIFRFSFLFVLLRGVYNFFQSIFLPLKNDHLVSLPSLCALLIQTNILASVTLKPQTRPCRVGAEPASVTLCSLSPFDLFVLSGLGAAQCVNSSIRLTPTRSDFLPSLTVFRFTFLR
jgi:hypothetical protein